MSNTNQTPDNLSNNNNFTAELKEKMNTLDSLIKLREKQIKHDVELSVETDDEEEMGLPGYTGIF
jgi:hypothetical protein